MPFWRVMRPTKKYVGLLFIDAEAVKRFSGVLLIIFVRIDAVVDNTELHWVDVEVLHDVGFSPFGDAYYRISHFDRGFFDPTAAVIAATELLALPGSEGFE